MKKFDFSGWATRNNLKCSDGRTILKDAFKHNDGQTVPLVWNHQHNDPLNVLGHALLENREDGVYVYGTFNDTEAGRNAKLLVEHGDISALSIFANQLKQQGANVLHGAIREVSLVLAGANPGAFIDSVIRHGEESDEEAIIYTGEDISLAHADEQEEAKEEEKEEPEEKSEDEETVADVLGTLTDKQMKAVSYVVSQALEHSDDDSIEHADTDDKSDGEETVADVLNSLTDKQMKVVEYMIGKALEDNNEIKHSEGGENTMKQNLFDNSTQDNKNILSHSAQAEILDIARSSGVGSLQEAIGIYAAENNLQHADVAISGFAQSGNGAVSTMFPEYVEAHPGRTPELITNDMGWVNAIMSKTQKIPHGRVRTSHIDIRNIDALQAKGYKKGNEKKLTGNYQLVRRTTDPQTVYVTSELHRDDVVDIEDFDYVQFQYNVDQLSLKETLAVATLFGDERPDSDPEKIFPDKIRPIWTDDELYTIHTAVDFEAMAEELQGVEGAGNFGENFIKAEAMVNTLRKARKDFRGTGKPDMFITPDMLSTMILARDRNGRRMYATENELAAAMSVSSLYEVTQMEGKVRTDSNGKKWKLLAIVVNMADYGYGASKGGDITHFTDFDIKFNQLQSLLETRKSGQLTRIKSAIVIEEEVTE